MLSYMSESALVLMGGANGAAVCVTTPSRLVFPAETQNPEPDSHPHGGNFSAHFTATVQKRTGLRGSSHSLGGCLATASFPRRG